MMKMAKWCFYAAMEKLQEGIPFETKGAFNLLRDEIALLAREMESENWDSNTKEESEEEVERSNYFDAKDIIISHFLEEEINQMSPLQEGSFRHIRNESSDSESKLTLKNDTKKIQNKISIYGE